MSDADQKWELQSDILPPWQNMIRVPCETQRSRIMKRIRSQKELYPVREKKQITLLSGDAGMIPSDIEMETYDFIYGMLLRVSIFILCRIF